MVARGDQISDGYLILGSVLRVEVDGTRMTESSPGAILRVRTPLEVGKRLSSLVTVTVCRGDSVSEESLKSLEELTIGYRREDPNLG
jgi:hypothetical protein